MDCLLWMELCSHVVAVFYVSSGRYDAFRQILKRLVNFGGHRLFLDRRPPGKSNYFHQELDAPQRLWQKWRMGLPCLEKEHARACRGRHRTGGLGTCGFARAAARSNFTCAMRE